MAQSGLSHAAGGEEEGEEWEARKVQQGGASEGTQETSKWRRIDRKVVTDLVHHIFSPHTAGDVPASTVALVSPRLSISFPFLPAPAPPLHHQSTCDDDQHSAISLLSQKALALFRFPAQAVNVLPFASWGPQVYKVEETTLAVAVPEHEEDKGEAKAEERLIVEKWSAELEWVMEVGLRDSLFAVDVSTGTPRRPVLTMRSMPRKIELVFTSGQLPSPPSPRNVAPPTSDLSAFDIPHPVTSEVSPTTPSDLIEAAGAEEHHLFLTHVRYLFPEPLTIPGVPSYFQDVALSLVIAVIGWLVPFTLFLLRAFGFGELASVTSKASSHQVRARPPWVEGDRARSRVEEPITLPSSPTAASPSQSFERPSRRSSIASQSPSSDRSTNPVVHSALRRSGHVHRRRASTAPASTSGSSATLNGSPEEPHHVHFDAPARPSSTTFSKLVDVVPLLLVHVRQTLDDIAALAWTIRQIVVLVTEFLSSIFSVGKGVLQGEAGGEEEEAKAHGVKKRRSSVHPREVRGRSRDGAPEKRAKHHEGRDVGDEAEEEEEQEEEDPKPLPTSYPMVRSPDLSHGGFSVEKYVAFDSKRSVSAPPAPLIQQVPFARPRRVSFDEPEGERYLPPTDPAHHNLPSIATADTPLAHLRTEIGREAALRGRSLSPVFAEEYSHHGVPERAYSTEGRERAETAKEAAEVGREMTGSPTELKAIEDLEKQLEEKRAKLLAEVQQEEGEVGKASPGSGGGASQFYGVAAAENASADPYLVSLTRMLPSAPHGLAPPHMHGPTDTAGSTPLVLSPFSSLAQTTQSTSSATSGTVALSLAQKLHTLAPGQRRTKEEAIDTPVEPQTPDEGSDDGHEPACASSGRRKSRDYGFEMSEAMAPPVLHQPKVEEEPEEPAMAAGKPSTVTYRSLAEARTQAQEGEGEAEELEELQPGGKLMMSEEEGTTTPRAAIMSTPKTPPTPRLTQRPRSAPTAFTPPGSPTASTFPSSSTTCTSQAQTSRLIRSHSHPSDTDLKHYYSPSSTLLSGEGALSSAEGGQLLGSVEHRGHTSAGGVSIKDDPPGLPCGKEATEALEEERAEKAPLRHPLPGGSTTTAATHEGGEGEGAGGKKKRRKGKKGGKK
ncbi:hypothetical protein Rt10032_c07g3047 [Rhodotorula toruloides]|uniref:Uncharacterized protein n=1 Tax=Rhodotorula toruloides TaxID=5286 RepID=A0A511KF74_RHOTO|nr:hypothetical protein Rt10032_c07g3047 [Rhodotorula toruloides]